MFGRPSLTISAMKPRQEYLKWLVSTEDAVMGVDTEPVVMDAMDTGDGDDYVAFPLLFAGASALYGLYGAGKALETWRYWADYQKNTGFRPRYPMRSGLYDWMPSTGGTLYGLGGLYSRTQRDYYRW